MSLGPATHLCPGSWTLAGTGGGTTLQRGLERERGREREREGDNQTHTAYDPTTDTRRHYTGSSQPSSHDEGERERGRKNVGDREREGEREDERDDNKGVDEN
jgi:hypothetical protein